MHGVESLTGLALLSLGIFAIAYIFIIMEHKFHINKSGVTILVAAILWVIAVIASDNTTEAVNHLTHETQSIFSLVIFLLCAMALVESLIHFGLFDWIQSIISRRKLSNIQLFWILGIFTFLLSHLLDNMSTTLIMIQIGRKIYRHKSNMLIFAASCVIAANAGGAASPIGDVTTLMIWLADKADAYSIIFYGTIPSILAFAIPCYLLSRKIITEEEVQKSHNIAIVEPYWPIISLGVFSFTLPVIFSLIGLPPFLGLLGGLGLVWIYSDFIAKRNHDNIHYKNGNIILLLQKADIATLKFFVGILLSVGALGQLGVLSYLSNALFGSGSVNSVIVGSISLGFLSGVLDNVPLVAAALKILPEATEQIMWVLLAITAGTGGSLLVVGSAAGVAASGQVKDLTFGHYAKIAAVPVLLGNIAAILAWYGSYLVIG